MTRYTLHSGVLRALRTTALPLVLLHAVSCGDDPNGPPPATTVTVSPSTSTRVAGQTQQFTATVANQPAGSSVVWSSANTSVATVNASTGLATGVAAGTTKIRATVGAAFAEADLTVTANTAPTVEAGADRDVNRGEAISISTVASDPQGQELTYSWTQLAGTPVTIANPGSATLSVTAPSGVTVLRFRVTVSDGSLSSSDEVGVFVFEDRAKAFFVRSNGDDAAAGTRAAPFKTLAKAIQAAAATQADVYAATGTYGERVVLQTGVSLYGGFEGAWTGRAPASAGVTSTIVGDGTGVLGASVSGLTVDGFDIESGPASTLGFGNSTYGVRLQSAQNVTISNNVIAASEGRVGLLGSNGIIGGSGLAGSNAGANRGGAGGLGGSGVGSAGGTGGDAGTVGQSGSPGSTGDRGAAGGNGGTGGTTLAPDGTAGGNGQNGTAGSVGVPGLVGIFAAAGYAPAQAASGQNGGSGGGGGGGGGGRHTSSGDQIFTGGGGGGGGGGGQGGGGGEGGTGGGGSFGVYVAQSTGITVTGNTIATAGGGVGGAGGQGGAGGFGNVGGAGNTLVEGGKGGAGGRGGDGAQGGRGGGGAGGPSITIVSVGSTVTQSGNTLQPGAGGAGGAPNGITGTSQATRTDP